MAATLENDDRETLTGALGLILNRGDEWYTSASFEQLFGNVHILRHTGVIEGFPHGNLSAILELRSNAVTIVQKLAWLHERKRAGDLDDGRWFYFGASDIVAFHILLRSLFDSVALAINRTAPKRGVTPTSFADLRKALMPGSEKEARTQESLGELAVPVRTCSWFEDLRQVRDDLVHHEAQTLLFLDDERILFQVHKGFNNRVLVPAVMFNDNVVDWTLYSALMMARLMVFLNRFADAVFAVLPQLRDSQIGRTSSSHPGYSVLRGGITQLLSSS